MLKIYTYSGCDTCRRALKFLRDRKVTFEEIPIRSSPPSPSELKEMTAAYGNVRRLFNASGADYKTLKLGERLPRMSQEETLGLLASNGNLVKRPFLIGNGVSLVGFNLTEWQGAFPDSGRAP